MSLRLIEILVPADRTEEIHELIGEREILGVWRPETSGERSMIRAVVYAQDVEPIIDAIGQRFPEPDAFRLVLLPVEGMVPRAAEDSSDELLRLRRVDGSRYRVSREELHSEVSEGTRLTPIFLAMTVLSSVVAVIGVVKNDIAALIGAMVIAPLLSPNVALALATTLGDLQLGQRALRANLGGVSIALAIAVTTGMLIEPNLELESIRSRIEVDLPDIGLALAAGCAGTLAFTSGLPGALIGVMVAVALLPPLVVTGLLLGSGNLAESAGAALLVLANVICVNLAGVSTFLLQGVRPRSWWEARKARRASRRALALWIGLLLVLIVALYLSTRD